MGLCLGLRKACAGLCSCIMASDISRDCSPCSSGKKCFLHSYTLWVLPSMNHPTRYQIPPLSTVPCGKKEQLSAGPFIVHDLRQTQTLDSRGSTSRTTKAPLYPVSVMLPRVRQGQHPTLAFSTDPPRRPRTGTPSGQLQTTEKDPRSFTGSIPKG